MKDLFNYLILVSVIICTSCTDETINEESFIGKWELMEWTLDVPLDINGDGLQSLNLLDEIDCSYSETIEFKSDGMYSLIIKHNPKIKIHKDALSGDYMVNLSCSEGVIGTASEYEQNGNQVQGYTYNPEFNTISILNENEIDVYSDENYQHSESKLNSKKIYIKVDQN